MEEASPLGTGGAILGAIRNLPYKDIVVINGDSMSVLDLDQFVNTSRRLDANVALALYASANSNRYGQVKCNELNEIIQFTEKGSSGPGLINAGIYYLNTKYLLDFDFAKNFSFESDFLQTNFSKRRIIGLDVVEKFIDIGVPDEYLRAQTYIPLILGAK